MDRIISVGLIAYALGAFTAYLISMPCIFDLYKYKLENEKHKRLSELNKMEIDK